MGKDDLPLFSGARLARATMAALGAAAGLAATALAHRALIDASAMPPLIAAFGASAVVLHGAPESELARARNVFGGSLIAAIAGVAAARIAPGLHGWMLAIAVVPLAIFLMALTDTMHPPAGALAFIAVAGPPEIRDLGWLYPLMPVGTGMAVMFAVAWLSRRLSPWRQVASRARRR